MWAMIIMKTFVYIDGYNLYYGLLRRSPFKWIDVVDLVTNIIMIQDPSSEVHHVRYFTAPVLGRFATNGTGAVNSQRQYHRALREINGQRIEIIEGYHTVEKSRAIKLNQPIDKSDLVEIWRFEEKQTDVNIALTMYRDATLNETFQQVLVSSDSDLELPLKLISGDFDNTLGLIIPRPQPSPDKRSRPVNKSLSNHTSWTRRYITTHECANSVMPDVIPTRKKPIRKPLYW